MDLGSTKLPARKVFEDSIQKLVALYRLKPTQTCGAPDRTPDAPLDTNSSATLEEAFVVDLSRPACGHVKKALKGREF